MHLKSQYTENIMPNVIYFFNVSMYFQLISFNCTNLNESDDLLILKSVAMFRTIINYTTLFLQYIVSILYNAIFCMHKLPGCIPRFTKLVRISHFQYDK